MNKEEKEEKIIIGLLIFSSILLSTTTFLYWNWKKEMGYKKCRPNPCKGIGNCSEGVCKCV